MKIRIIPTILLRKFGVVKTIQYGSHRPLGVATNFARVYNSREVDELIVLDIDATRENRAPDLELIRDIADECFMPLTVGGGIKSLDDAKQIIQSGADKIVINTASFYSPHLIEEIAMAFGRQAVVVSVDVKLVDSKYQVFSDGGKQGHNLDPIQWAKQLECWGAGEIFLSSIDRDGCMNGYDIELVRQVSQSVGVPIIASGGAGKLSDVGEVVRIGGASAIACASLFHYTQITPLAIKNYLKSEGMNVRL